MTEPAAPPAAKRGRGRPAIGARVHVHLPPDLLAEVDRQADAAHMTRAQMIRALVSTALTTVQAGHAR
jgi:metal-responsive CopG/Arc/MetJ family transcriptional regulator